MRYKVAATIPGEPKSRQIFCPTRLSAGDAMSNMLADPTVPVGTEVVISREEEVVVERYVKKEGEKEGERKR
jgi:hypothetical protein